MARDIVIFHNDADGYCSAGLVSLLNKKLSNKQPIYLKVMYGIEDRIIDIVNGAIKPVPWGPKGSNDEMGTLYVLDFSFSAQTMMRLIKKLDPQRVVYLDHHATSVEQMSEFIEAVKKNNLRTECLVINKKSECGASLTWKHVKYRCPELKGNKEIEYIVNLCKDYDLWIHKYRESLPFVTGVSIKIPHPEQWRRMLCSEGLYNKYTAIGKGVIKQQLELAKKIVRKPEKWETMCFNGAKTIILNINPQWVNIVSHELLDKTDLEAVLCYSISGLNKVHISMRSKGEFDTGEFMQKWFQGGGHKHAAGGHANNYNNFCYLLQLAAFGYPAERDREVSSPDFLKDLTREP